MTGQYITAFHFLHQSPAGASAAAIAYGRKRYGAEVRRLCAVMDARLADAAWLAGAEYSVADVAVFPWIALHRRLDIDLAAAPHLARWYDAVRERPAVRRGMDVPTRLQLERHSRQYERKGND